MHYIIASWMLYSQETAECFFKPCIYQHHEFNKDIFFVERLLRWLEKLLILWQNPAQKKMEKVSRLKSSESLRKITNKYRKYFPNKAMVTNIIEIISNKL